MCGVRLSLVLAAAAAIALCFSCIGTADAMDSSKKHGKAAMVRATYHNYLPENIQWNFNEANAYCSTWDANMPLAWRKQFGWTSFCGPIGPTGPASCGKCLLLRNANTGATTKARIIDQCTNGGLDLDYHVFRSLDSDGNGMNQGHLTVIYQFVTC